MAISFYLSATNSDLSGGADFNKVLSTATETAGTLSVAVASAATEVSYGYTTSGVPGVGGTSTGSFSVEINVTTANSNITLSVALARVNSAGTQQAVTAYATGQSAGTTGVKTFTFTDPALGTWAAGDRLRVQYRFVNGAMSTQTVGIGTGTTNEACDTPFYAAQTTLYWVGGSGTWGTYNALNWALTSGGTGGASYPISTTNVIFDSASDAGSGFTVTVASTASCTNMTASGLDQTMTLSGSGAMSIYGNLSVPSTNFTNSYTGTISFLGTTGTQTVTSNGNSFNSAITKFGASTLQLQDNFSTNGLFTLTSGTVDLQSFTLSVGSFNSSNSNTRSIAFGTGNITVTGNNAQVWYCNVLTGLTLTGTPDVRFSYSGSTGTRTIIHGGGGGGVLANLIPVSITNGTDTLVIQNAITNLDFTGFSGTWSNAAVQIYGNLLLSTGMTVGSGTGSIQFLASANSQNVTSNGKTIDAPVTKGGTNTLYLQDNLTLGSTRTFTHTSGTVDLQSYILAANIYSVSNSNTRAIAFGTGKISLSGNAATVWDGATLTGFTYTGTPLIELTYSGATGTRTVAHGNTAGGSETTAISFSVTAGSDTVAITGTGYVKNLNFTGFTGTASNATLNIYGNLTATTVTTFVASGINFLGTTGTQTITTGTTTLGAAIVKNSATTLQLIGNVTSSSTFTLTSGSLDLQSYTLGAQSFVSSNSNTRSIAFGTGKISLSGSSATVWSTSTGTNLTTTGTSTGFVELTYSGSTGTRTIVTDFNNAAPASFKVISGSDTLSITNTSRIIGLDLTGFSGVVANTAVYLSGDIVLTSAATYTAGSITGWYLLGGSIQGNGAVIQFPLIKSGGATTTLTGDVVTTEKLSLQAGTLDLQSYSFTASYFTFDSSSSTRSLQFGTGKIRLTGSNTTVWICGVALNFSCSATSNVELVYSGATGTRTVQHGTTSGTESNAVSFSTVAGSDTVSFSGVIRNLNFTGFSGICSASVGAYGDVTLGTTATVYSLPLTMRKSSGTQTLTSNGNTLGSISKSGAGALQLVDAMSLAGGLTLSAGTFDANDKNVTIGAFVSTTGTRTLTMGSGTWTLTNAGTVWNINATGLTFNKGTANIVLSNTTTSARTFAGGGLTYNNLEIGGSTGTSTLTFTGSNTFDTISSTKTVAHTISFTSGTTTTVSDWTVQGTSGNIVTINAVTSGSQATLDKSGGGTINVDYVSIQDSNATPGSTWYAGLNSVNVSNNTGWIFAGAPTTYFGNMLLMF